MRLKGGREVTYDTPFAQKESDEKLVKFNLTDMDGDREGPWIELHPDDVEDHDNDVKDPPEKVRLCVMRNTCLAGIPCAALVPYRMMGENRPALDMRELIDPESNITFIHPERRDIMTDEEVREFFAGEDDGDQEEEVALPG